MSLPMPSVKYFMGQMTSELSNLAARISDESIERFTAEILKERRIYLAGAGRSGLIARAFAMRLMHLGMESYVVGETVTPAMRKDDMLIIISGSGETKTMIDNAVTARSIGGLVCLITGHPESKIAAISDLVICLPAEAHNAELDSTYEIRQLKGESKSLSMPLMRLGTLFETSALVFADAFIASIIEIKHCDIKEVVDRFSNIQ